MISNILIFLLIFSNSIVVIYLLYQLYLKIKMKCCNNDNIDPFADTDIYYKRLIDTPINNETEIQNEEAKKMMFP